MIQEKDYLNGRIFHLKSFYLGWIASFLTSFSSSSPTSNSSPSKPESNSPDTKSADSKKKEKKEKKKRKSMSGPDKEKEKEKVPEKGGEELKGGEGEGVKSPIEGSGWRVMFERPGDDGRRECLVLVKGKLCCDSSFFIYLCFVLRASFFVPPSLSSPRTSSPSFSSPVFIRHSFLISHLISSYLISQHLLSFPHSLIPLYALLVITHHLTRYRHREREREREWRRRKRKVANPNHTLSSDRFTNPIIEIISYTIASSTLFSTSFTPTPRSTAYNIDIDTFFHDFDFAPPNAKL